MTALEGTLSTPLGAVPKKTALLVVGGAVLVIGVVWYRSKQTGDVSSAGASEINPATGYPYGSPEDAAAMANQDAYTLPANTGGGGGGGASIPSGGIGGAYVSNGQWAQAAAEYMVEAGLITDATQLSAALGAYITGQPTDAAQRSLISQAIAFQGYPPIAGPSGYPPSINTGNPVPTSPSPSTPTPIPTTHPPRRYVFTAGYRTVNPPWNSTLSGIVSHLRTKGIIRSATQIAGWNGITNINVIQPSRQLWVDPPGTYTGTQRIT